MLILIVDDEPIMCRAISAVLQATGFPYKIQQFSGKHCGAETLEWLDTNRPDYCILDILLNGVSGIDVANKIKDLYNDVRILLMTGCSDDSIYFEKAREYINSVNGVTYLQKRDSSEGSTFIGSLLKDMTENT